MSLPFLSYETGLPMMPSELLMNPQTLTAQAVAFAQVLRDKSRKNPFDSAMFYGRMMGLSKESAMRLLADGGAGKVDVVGHDGEGGVVPTIPPELALTANVGPWASQGGIRFATDHPGVVPLLVMVAFPVKAHAINEANFKDIAKWLNIEAENFEVFAEILKGKFADNSLDHRMLADRLPETLLISGLAVDGRRLVSTLMLDEVTNGRIITHFSNVQILEPGKKPDASTWEGPDFFDCLQSFYWSWLGHVNDHGFPGVE